MSSAAAPPSVVAGAMPEAEPAAAAAGQQICRLITLGDSATGKTSLLQRYTVDQFDEDIKPTMGIDFQFKNVFIRDREIKCQVWDTAGQERFRTITFSYYRGAHGIVLVYDVTNPATFQSIRKWMSDVRTYAEPDVCILLIGNKCDLEEQRRVTWEQGEALAKEYNVTFFECSAKEDVNVARAFNSLVEEVLEHWAQDGQSEAGRAPEGAVAIDGEKPKKKKGCCK